MTEKKIREQIAQHTPQQDAKAGTSTSAVPPRTHRPVQKLPKGTPSNQPDPAQQASQASPQYVGHNAGLHDESKPYFTGDLKNQTAIRFTNRQQTTGQQPVYDDYEVDEVGGTYPSQVPASAVRWNNGAQRYVRRGNNEFFIHNQPRSKYAQKQTQAGFYEDDDDDDDEEYDPHAEARKQRRTRLIARITLILASICFIMLIGFVTFNALGTWIQTTRDDWQYGRPRTYQTDAVVGINDSAASPSHFIAINLNGRVEIIFLPGGDATKAVIFNGPYIVGDQGSLTPITLSFKDVTGNGKLDMLVHDGDKVFYYINEKNTFRPQQPGEHITP